MGELHATYGTIAKVSGLIGHPDLLFIYDGDEIRKVFRREEVLPHRYGTIEKYFYLEFSHNIDQLYILDHQCHHCTTINLIYKKISLAIILV